MRITSFKAVEAYLYASVLSPLKGLNGQNLDISSPISSDDGKHFWELQVAPEPPTRVYRRNYQRTQASRKANQLVTMYTGDNSYVVASYNPRSHWVKIYERPFKTLRATPLMGKLYEMFEQNTPFTKIISELDAPLRRQGSGRRARNMPTTETPDYDDTEGYSEEEGF